MSKARKLADLLDSNGDVKSSSLDNVDGLPTRADSAGMYLKVKSDNSTTEWSTVTLPKLDSPSITGATSIDSGANITHTIGNWSDDITYVITPTNCTVGSVNTSGQFVVTHTSGSPSYTIKATTDSLGLDDSALVTKNILMSMSAPTLSSPADAGTAENVVYTITSTDTGDNKIILDIGSSNFTYQSVSVGSASKVGNTVECTGFTTGNPAVTIQFTAEATYSVTAKSVDTTGTYGDSSSSAADSITIQNYTATTRGYTSSTTLSITHTGDYDLYVVGGGGAGAKEAWDGTSMNNPGGGSGYYGTSANVALTSGDTLTISVGGAGSASSISKSGTSLLSANGGSRGSGRNGGHGGSGGGGASGNGTDPGLGGYEGSNGDPSSLGSGGNGQTGTGYGSGNNALIPPGGSAGYGATPPTYAGILGVGGGTASSGNYNTGTARGSAGTGNTWAKRTDTQGQAGMVVIFG